MARIIYGYQANESYGRATAATIASGYGAFGDVSIIHGYAKSYSGYELAGAYFGDAPGRSPGDDYSKAPYFIPLDIDPNTDPVALRALSLGISYANAQGVDPAMAAKINDSIAATAMWAAKLAEAMSKAPLGGSLQADARDWLQQSALFQDQGQRLISGELPQARFPEWYALGQKLAATANSLAQTLGMPTFTIGGTLAPPGFDKALALLKFLIYSGIAITGLYFGAQVAGIFKGKGAAR